MRTYPSRRSASARTRLLLQRRVEARNPKFRMPAPVEESRQWVPEELRAIALETQEHLEALSVIFEAFEKPHNVDPGLFDYAAAKESATAVLRNLERVRRLDRLNRF